MLLVDKATTPENTVYFISALLNGLLSQKDSLDYSTLYKITCKQMGKDKINTTVFTMALDFLFLLNKIGIDKEGKIHVYKNVTDSSKK